MKKVKDTIRSFDMFGMEIHLKFDGKSHVHYTIPGGLLSILLYFIYTHHLSNLVQ
jgi:hypothetical protein